MVQPQSEPVLSWRQRAQQLQREAHVVYFVFKHPRMHWYARLVAACTSGYVLSPIQLIPNFIPVIGFLDDLLVLFLSVKLLRRITPPDVLAECRELAEAAEIARKIGFRPNGPVMVALALATICLLAVIVAGALTVIYSRH